MLAKRPRSHGASAFKLDIKWGGAVGYAGNDGHKIFSTGTSLVA